MSFLFKNKGSSKSPPELVQKCCKYLTELGNGNSAHDKATEKLAGYLNMMKLMLVGDADTQPKEEEAVALCTEVTKKSDFIALVFACFSKLEFEARKDVTLVFGAIMRRQLPPEGVFAAAEYIANNQQLIDTLVGLYNSSELALSAGSMLRDCFRHPSLAKSFLESGKLLDLVGLIESPVFEVSSDAFTTFKYLLTRHSDLASTYLKANYDVFFAKFNALLTSKNYVTRRQSLKLLEELLLDQANVSVMLKYISDAQNLKLMMNLLKDSSRNIQFEAFHVFKVFVANPNKPTTVVNILANNRQKLVAYLTDFHEDKDSDEQFMEEKQMIINEIGKLQVIDS